MFSAIIYKPNHVPRKQRLVQSMSDPIYYRLPRSRLYVGSYYAGFTLGVIGSVYGIYTLITGKAAAE